MDNLVEVVADLKRRAQAVRESLQSARVELEALDQRVTELARKELHHGC
jgi:uncharacterized protein involved in exopolysaccharide biosynthesis